MNTSDLTRIGRRAFLKNGSLLLAATGLDLAAPRWVTAVDVPAKDSLRFGMLTDLHYADKPPAGEGSPPN